MSHDAGKAPITPITSECGNSHCTIHCPKQKACLSRREISAWKRCPVMQSGIIVESSKILHGCQKLRCYKSGSFAIIKSRSLSISTSIELIVTVIGMMKICRYVQGYIRTAKY